MNELSLRRFGLVTVEEIAARYGVGPRAVQNWIRDGMLPAVLVGKGKLILVPEKSLKGFEKPKKGPGPKARKGRTA
jgi:excisionase family DNA binding protein